MKNVKTLVYGGSEKPERYSNKAIRMLLKHGHPVVSIGQKAGQVETCRIQTGQPAFEGIDTITLYLGPQHQAFIYTYCLDLKPRRILFNPGTENEEFKKLAEEQGIVCQEACTLVLLSTGQY